MTLFRNRKCVGHQEVLPAKDGRNDFNLAVGHLELGFRQAAAFELNLKWQKVVLASVMSRKERKRKEGGNEVTHFYSIFLSLAFFVATASLSFYRLGKKVALKRVSLCFDRFTNFRCLERMTQQGNSIKNTSKFFETAFFDQLLEQKF